MSARTSRPQGMLKVVFAFTVLCLVASPLVAQQQYSIQDATPKQLQYDSPVTANLSDTPSVNFAPPLQYAPQQEYALPQEYVPPQQYSDPLASRAIECNCPECVAAKEAAPSKKAAPKKNPCASSHKGLFYANDFSYLKDGVPRTCLGDRFKQIKIGNGYLDIGGQIRYRYHHEQGLGQQAGATRFQDTVNDFGLTRVRLYANWQVNDRVRVFAEGIHAAVVGANDEYVPRGIDENFGDLLNLFVDVKVLDSTTVRIGRQEFLFGDQRLVSPLDWANTRQRFDGVRTTTKLNDWTFDGFYSQFVPVVVDSFDNPDQDLDFFGTHWAYKGFKNATLEAYYFGLNNNAGTGVENINTFGARLVGATERKLLYEVEAMTQNGTNDLTGQDIRAHSYTVGFGRKFENVRWKPTLWGFYDFASGDDSGQGDFNQFNDLFPLGHKYHGFIDAVQRSNLQSPNVRLALSPTKKLSLLLWYHRFFSEERDSDILSLGGTPDQDPTEDDFGNEIDFVATRKFGNRSSLQVGYSHFFRGAKILAPNDADLFYLQWTTNF